MEKKPVAHARRQKKLILRALTDPKFRAALTARPARALGKKPITPEMQKEIGHILDLVKTVEIQIGSLAEQLLCANGGPCGIA